MAERPTPERLAEIREVYRYEADARAHVRIDSDDYLCLFAEIDALTAKNEALAKIADLTAERDAGARAILRLREVVASLGPPSARAELDEATLDVMFRDDEPLSPVAERPTCCVCGLLVSECDRMVEEKS